MQPADSGVPSIPLSVAAATADSDDIYGTDGAVLLQPVSGPSVETPATREDVERGLNDALHRIYQTRGVPKFATPTSAQSCIRLPIQRRSDSEAFQLAPCGARQAAVLLSYQHQQQQQLGGAGSLRRTASDSAVQLPIRVAYNEPAALLNRQCDQQQLGNATLLPLLPATVESASSLTSTVPLVPATATTVRHTYLLTSPQCSVGSSPIPLPLPVSVPAAAAATLSVRGPRPPRYPVTAVAARPPTSSATTIVVTGGLNVVRPPFGASVSLGFSGARQPRPTSSSTTPAAAAVASLPAAATRAAAAGPAAVVPEKQLRNRAAAAKCREKRLQKERKMSKRLDEMQTENARLMEEERQLRERVDQMQRLLQCHSSDSGACRLASGEFGVEF